MSEVKEAEPEKIVEVVADKGYEDTEDMEQLAMRLAYREDLYAIIGPYASQNVEIIARECAVSHKPLIAPTASSADLVRLYAQEGFLWSLVETDISQCETLLSIALEEDCRRISLIASDDIYGQTFIDWFAFQANELGVSVDKVLKYTIGQPEAAMCEALSTSPEALICVPGKPAEERCLNNMTRRVLRACFFRTMPSRLPSLSRAVIWQRR